MKLANKFFETARERYYVRARREAGLPRPWSEDPIYQQWRFCNVFREHDKTTIWFRENVRDFVDSPDHFLAIFATIAFRWFNRIGTGELIRDLLVGTWNTKEARRRLQDVRPLVTGAYIIKGRDGMSKLDGVLACIDEAHEKISAMIPFMDSLEQAHQELMAISYLGPFMAYEVVTDLRHTQVLRDAPDIMTWANPGPGCTRGLSRVVHGDLSQEFRRGSVADRREMLGYMSTLLAMSQDDHHWPSTWPRWEMREVEHWLCEYDKYQRAAEGYALKRRF